MANVTIPDLTSAASVAADTLFEVVIDPSTTPASRKVAASQIRDYALDLPGDFYDQYLPGSTTDRYTAPGLCNLNTRAAVAIPAANTIYAYPFRVSKRVTLDRLATRLVTQNGVTTFFRIGVWAATSASNDYPSALIVDTGDIGCGSGNSTTGAKIVTVSAALSPLTRYWIGVVSDATPAIHAFGLAQGLPTLGVDSSLTLNQGCIAIAFTYGALGTFPASAVPSAFGSGSAPILYYRANAT